MNKIFFYVKRFFSFFQLICYFSIIGFRLIFQNQDIIFYNANFLNKNCCANVTFTQKRVFPTLESHFDLQSTIKENIQKNSANSPAGLLEKIALGETYAVVTLKKISPNSKSIPVFHYNYQQKKSSISEKILQNTNKKKNIQKTAKVINIIGTGLVFLYNYTSLLPQMPYQFYENIQVMIETKNGNLNHVPHIQEALNMFLTSPPTKEAVNYKICQILENPQKYTEELGQFYCSPLRWLELLDRKTTILKLLPNMAQTEQYSSSITLHNLIEEFEQSYIDLDKACHGTLTREAIENFRHIENQDVKNSLLESNDISFHSLNQKFEGDQEFFNFLFRKLMFKFWCGVWLVHFEFP